MCVSTPTIYVHMIMNLYIKLSKLKCNKTVLPMGGALVTKDIIKETTLEISTFIVKIECIAGVSLGIVGPIFIKIMSYMPYSLVTLCINLKRISPAVPKIRSFKRISLYFSSLQDSLIRLKNLLLL